jgi:hypothetical protein
MKLDFEGTLWEVSYQVQSIKKPATRLIKREPFKHLSSLYPVKDEAGKVKHWLFDCEGKAYIWQDMGNPKAWHEIPIDEYVDLKRTWYWQNRKQVCDKYKIPANGGIK